ncbi:hypothetical protein [Aquimarina sp. I32.4]|uniref:hypothetical protein n=1 Tax=Aquimarina sp. I32.4 TaxID=2053903 RepID=UPI000CDE987D|nr:hypothetical protein [Aquimarina sp. I32.4]
MKKLNLFFAGVLLASVCLFSCSSDDDNKDNGAPAGDNVAEEREIPVSELKSGVTIPVGKLESGTPPTPTGTMNFSINTTQQEAYLTKGFNISFSSTDQVAGAYIQFKDVNGTPIEGYYDVQEFITSGGGKSAAIKGRKNAVITSKMNEGNLEIDVDFAATVAPGRFCYDICIYDEQGNISQIEEVCVEVEAWGGNDAIAGEWIFDREEPNDIENEIGATIECENGETLTDVPYNQEEKDVWIFVLNADGTYYESYDEKGKSLDNTASATNCSAVYTNEYEYKEKYSGNWAYNEENETISIVDFKHENLTTNTVDNYEEGEVYFEGDKVEVINGELVITTIYNEGGVDVTEKIIFKRK